MERIKKKSENRSSYMCTMVIISFFVFHSVSYAIFFTFKKNLMCIYYIYLSGIILFMYSSESSVQNKTKGCHRAPWGCGKSRSNCRKRGSSFVVPRGPDFE